MRLKVQLSSKFLLKEISDTMAEEWKSGKRKPQHKKQFRHRNAQRLFHVRATLLQLTQETGMKDFFELKHLDDTAAVFSIDRDQKYVASLDVKEKILLPPRATRSFSDFCSWWSDRAVPKTRHNLKLWLEEHGYRSTSEYLLKNLALSMSDCYWVKPVGSSLQWKDVNFFDNDFGILKNSNEEEKTLFSPDASTGGDLPKFWICEGNQRYLIKGNEGGTYQQSYNEAFASLIHRKQHFDAHVDYSLVNLGERGTGCKCEAFTDSSNEFISAWDLFGHENYRSGEMSRKSFAELMSQEGLDEKESTHFLNYMALSDFLLANNDRHFNNIGVIRDPATLRVKRLAPIFDSGNSMGFGSVLEMTVFLKAKTRGFNNTFQKSISTIRDLDMINISALPSAEEIRIFYNDSGMSEKDIARMATLFHDRVEILKGFQHGRSYYDLTRMWFEKK